MPKFEALGMSFRLFEADTSEASRLLEEAMCSFCGVAGPAFELGIGDDLIVACGECGTENPLDADDRIDGACRSCGATVSFPSVGETIACCYRCLRAGRAAHTQDTELGMVRWEDAVIGLTHGMPADSMPPGWETTPGDCGWLRARVDRDELLELVRSPSYISWQGERWRFCCGRLMTFIGGWSTADFIREAEDGDGERLFLALMDDADPDFYAGIERGIVSTYVFRCTHCGSRRGYYDYS